MKREYIFFVISIMITYFLLTRIISNNKTMMASSIEDKGVYTVIIDAGHGGTDAGKVAGKVLEKDINLEIAKRLEARLKTLGYRTVMIRDDDEMPNNKQDEMWLRQKRANATDGDIFVSIHQNSSNSASAKGFQVYYFKKSEKSNALANAIYNSIKVNVNQSTKFEPIENSDYYVLRTTKMPAVLVECGFLSNEGERWLLTTADYQEKMAWGIAKGIEDYFNSN